MKVVADDKIPFLKGVLEPFADVQYLPGKEITKKDIADADALIVRTRTKCNESLLSGTKVKFIATATIGFDHIDTKWCENNGIAWTNAPGCNSGSVYQYIASVMVSLAAKHNFNLFDRSLGVIGVGNVGKKIVKLGEWLGMRVMLNDPPRERNESTCGFISLDGIIRECDIITCHVPLNLDGKDKTYHLINDKILSRLNKGTILINSSRGEVVDNKSLLNALTNRSRLSGAVLDVWENEPDINIDLLAKLDFATPHIAGYSADGKINGTTMSIHALSRYFGLPLQNWEPTDLPLPENHTFTVDCLKKSIQEVLSEVILHTYKVDEDDARLRKSVETFEKQRGNYPLRREFHAFTLNLVHNHSNLDKILGNLGFKIKT